MCVRRLEAAATTTSQRPALAVLAVDPLIDVRRVGGFHGFAVPLEFLSRADRKIPKQDDLGEKKISRQLVKEILKTKKELQAALDIKSSPQTYKIIPKKHVIKFLKL